MTTSRVIRGTRAKIFFYICAILIIVGIIACYNNTLSQLDDVRKSNDICHQQEENLSTQLQVISDYKQRLEKSLKTEQADHQQIKANLDNQLKEERSKYEREARDMKLKLGSLQQHFNLLQTQYDDYKEETSKSQKQQQEEINNLEVRISELIEEQKKTKSSKDNLKNQYIHLERQKDKLEKQLEDNLHKTNNGEEINNLKKENAELKLEIQHLKEKCGSEDVLPEPLLPNSSKNDSINKPDLFPNPNQNDERQVLPVLPEPINENPKMVSSSSSTTANKVVLKPSQGNLGLARPIFLPTVTPATVPKDKLPDGVVAIPDKKEEEIVNARYQNVKESAQNEQLQVEKAKEAKDETERDNVAHEVFDAPLFHDELQFGDNEQLKPPNFDKKHIDTLGKEKKNYDQDQGEYKEQNDVQLEENDDDDGDGYDDHLVRQKEPAVRN